MYKLSFIFELQNNIYIRIAIEVLFWICNTLAYNYQFLQLFDAIYKRRPVPGLQQEARTYVGDVILVRLKWLNISQAVKQLNI